MWVSSNANINAQDSRKISGNFSTSLCMSPLIVRPETLFMDKPTMTSEVEYISASGCNLDTRIPNICHY